MVHPARNEPKEEDVVRRALGRQLGHTVKEDDKAWILMVKERFVKEVQDGFDVTLKDLKAKYLEYREIIYPAKSPQGDTQDTDPDERHLTLMKIMAIEGAQLPDVVAFRREILGCRLLEPKEGPAWIERNQGPPPHSWWVKIRLPDGIADPLKGLDAVMEVPEDKRGLGAGHYEGLSRGFLAYPFPFPSSQWVTGGTNEFQQVRLAPLRTGTPVWRLKIAANAVLRHCHRWEEECDDPWKYHRFEEQVVAFVLCGSIPLYPAGTATIHRDELSGQCHKITIEVIPRLSGSEVAQLYSQVRRRVFNGKDKPMSDKHLTLAVFMAERLSECSTWGALMAEWNKKHGKKWRYYKEIYFSRNARWAWRRMTGKEWERRPGKKGEDHDA